MEHASLFPFLDYWWVYLAFSLLIFGVLSFSLFVYYRKPHTISLTEAGFSAAVWFFFAMVFNVLLFYFAKHEFESDPQLLSTYNLTADQAAWKISLEFFTGYLVEKALAVDNLFVFLVIFRFFHIPSEYQQRVLFYGLFGALVLRAIFIALGAAIMSLHWVNVAFGIFLIYQGAQFLRGSEPELNPEKNLILRLLRKYLPVTSAFHDQKFIVRVDGRWLATPLLVTLIFVEITDVLFAFDSVPAIFGITKEPLVVFTSNVFAVIDLRSLYFLLIAFIVRFRFLDIGLAFVLMFIGLKMAFLDLYLGEKVPTELSLLIVFSLIMGSILISLLRPPKESDQLK